MKYWVAEVPFSGKAKVIIESKTKPSENVFRSLIHADKLDYGWPLFETNKMKIRQIDQREYKNIKKMIKKQQIISEILKNS